MLFSQTTAISHSAFAKMEDGELVVEEPSTVKGGNPTNLDPNVAPELVVQEPLTMTGGNIVDPTNLDANVAPELVIEEPVTLTGGIFTQMWSDILGQDQSTIFDELQKTYIDAMKGLIDEGKFDLKKVCLHVCRDGKELSELLVKSCNGSSFGDQVVQLGDTFICCPVNEFDEEWEGTCCCLFPTDF